MKKLSCSTRTLLTALAITLGLTGLMVPSAARACPFCSAPSLTLSEQLGQADVTVLVQWAEASPMTEKSEGSTTYEVKQVVKNIGEKVKAGDRITLPRFRSGRKGDLFVLMGSKGAMIDWGSPLEVTETSFNYMVQAPSTEAPATKRLEYFVRFLEFQDQMIANDAYGEFANAPYEDITKIKASLPREKILHFLTSKDTPATRLGLYGLLIGLCGRDEDVKTVEAKILEKSEDFRLGIDGIMSGYLLLTGSRGLDVLEQHKLRNRDVPFSETYAAMQALRFMWRYGEDRIEKDRLRASMRVLLDRPELADLVIADLARWKDWSVQDALMKMYGRDEYNIPSIKRAIVRYMLVCSKDVPEATAGETATEPAHVTRARASLAELRQKDEKTVNEAERFFLLQ